ncbi:MAG: cytochrome c, partial [Pseudomonadales bacterium]|nr:cytochrome c [Pseudomonadales bacterium]
MLAALWCLFAAPEVGNPEVPDSPAAVERGRYLVAAGGCVSCHEGTAHADSLSGGLALESDFGTFYAPNISSDPEHGIGGWTEAEFLSAVMRGVSPGGQHYYPAFPYGTYARAEMADIQDLRAFMRTLPADATPSRGHDVGFPFSIRRALGGWKLLFGRTDWVLTGEDLSPEVLRGRYLVESLGHCGECHT